MLKEPAMRTSPTKTVTLNDRQTIIDGRKVVFANSFPPQNREILGCHVVGERAVEIAQVAAGAISAEMRVDDLLRFHSRFRPTRGILHMPLPRPPVNRR